MENKTQIKKLYEIARAYRCTDEYIAYIEYALQGNSVSDRDLANIIYKAAMLKYDAAVRKHADEVEANCVSMADKLNCSRAFAIKYGLLYDYVIYLERIISNVEKFDMKRVLSALTEGAICMYDIRLRSKIDASTGIKIIGGYKNAV